MARAKKKKRSFIYPIFLTIWIIGLLCAAYYGLGKVWIYAEEYEASRPSNTMDAYVEQLNENFWNDSMAATIASMEHEVQTDDECRDFIKTMIDSGVTYSRTSGTDSSKLVYNLKCENGVFGKVTLKEDQSMAESVEFGMLPWIVEKEEFDFNGLYSAMTITVPSSYTVQLNGVTLGPEYIVEDGIHLDLLDAYYKDYPNLPTKCTYRFENIIGRLEPVVFNEAGEEVSIDESLDDSQYVTYADDATVEMLTDFVSRFEIRYRTYSSGYGDEEDNYQRVLPYIIAGSDLDMRLQAASDGLSWSHTTGIDIWGTTVESVIQIDATTWIVRETTSTTAYGPNTASSDNTMELIVVEKAPGDCRVIAMTGV